jgi:hypothetical protein
MVEDVLHRQGKNLESTSNNRASCEAVKHHPRRKQVPATFAPKLIKCRKERDKEAYYKVTKPKNNRQHTIRTKTPPYTNNTHTCTCMPSAEPLVRAGARPGPSRNPCVRCGSPLQQ